MKLSLKIGKTTLKQGTSNIEDKPIRKNNRVENNIQYMIAKGMSICRTNDVITKKIGTVDISPSPWLSFSDTHAQTNNICHDISTPKMPVAKSRRAQT